MDLPGFTKVATNCDVLILIYKRLDFEDQLRLAQVSDILKSVFENFIWTVNYRRLNIYESNHNYLVTGNKRDRNYLVTNETAVNRLLLTADGLQEFLSVYAEKVQELTADVPLDINQLKNITRLIFEIGVNSLAELIQSVAVNCLYLESLELTNCSPSYKNTSILDVATVESLLRMGNLKRLCLRIYLHCNNVIKFKHVRDLFFKMKLEILELSIIVQPDDDDDVDDNQTVSSSSLTNPPQLKQLEIWTSFDPRKWSNNFSSFLTIFKSLLSLSLGVTDGVNNSTLAIIATSCQNLKKFCILSTTFINIESFLIPPNVTELSVRYCRGLTHKNLKQILTETKINKFLSAATEYEGVYEDFRISPLIDAIALDRVDMCSFTSAYSENENLKHLSWCCSRGCGNYDRIVTGVPVASCINLETLDMRDGQMALDMLLQLKHLRKFTANAGLSMEYIVALLRHPSLRELTVRVADNQAEAPDEGFPTNVTSLTLLYRITSSIEYHADFWLDLLCQNSKMSLTFTSYFGIERLRSLTKYKNFPTRLRIMEICGFAISCDDLKRNVDAALERIRYLAVPFDYVTLK